jgi:DNA-binding Xre family transcriptional regulator
MSRLRRKKPFTKGTTAHLAEYRHRAGLTQAELAERAGCATLTVVRAENGYAITTPTLAHFAEVLECEPGDLLM